MNMTLAYNSEKLWTLKKNWRFILKERGNIVESTSGITKPHEEQQGSNAI